MKNVHIYLKNFFGKKCWAIFCPKYRVTLLLEKLTGPNVFSIETLFPRPSSLFRHSGNVHMYVHTYTYVGNMNKVAIIKNQKNSHTQGCVLC
jgi:hypothetical protein